MVNQNLLRSLDDADLELELENSVPTEDELTSLITDEQSFEVGDIVSGRVTKLIGGDVVVDIGYKSEGVVPSKEFDEGDRPDVGDVIDVMLESVEDERGLVSLSYRRAERAKKWDELLRTRQEGDVVVGKVTRKVKGGLLVDIGVGVFLPSSQVDVRRPSNINDYLDRDIECLILKIDAVRRNIVVSRRQLIEREREKAKSKLFESIEVGQRRKGVVKNIAGFGAFVDLGGVDGLLHVSDMSWERIGHPSEMVKIDQELEVVVLSIDRDRERIAVGLKQKQPSPWENIEGKYPVGAKIKGEVVNVMNYGAFVRLEPGIEGLVHISEMSWLRRIDHPSELVSVGDEVEVVVLGIKKDKKEISLGMKQTQANPWDQVKEKYPKGVIVKGTVQNRTNYGAFIQLEEGIDGLLHVSDMSWLRKVNHPSEVLTKGQEVECQVLDVDQERKRIALGMKQLKDDPWVNHVPDTYTPGAMVKGKVTKVTNFGVFVELEHDLEGLLHVSELAEHKVEDPEEVVKVGQEIECRVLRIDTEDRKIALSLKKHTPESLEAAAAEDAAKKGSRELKGGLGAGGPLFTLGSEGEAGAEGEEPAIEKSDDE